MTITSLHPVWRLRLATAAVVTCLVSGSLALWPDPDVRARWTYLVNLTLGYGHLLGGLWFARSRMRAMAPTTLSSPRLWAAFLWLGALNAFALYAWSLSVLGEWIVFVFLGLATWHTFENDAGLQRAYEGELRLPEVSRHFRDHLLPFGNTLLFLIVAAASLPRGPLGGNGGLFVAGALAAVIGASLVILDPRPSGKLCGALLTAGALSLPGALHQGSPLLFVDVFNASVLYHVVSWLLFLGDRGRRLAPPARRSLVRRLVAVHLVPAVACVVLVAAPFAVVAEVRRWLFSPAVYLFWSVAHVIQTLVVRGVEPRRPAAAAPELAT